MHDRRRALVLLCILAGATLAAAEEQPEGRGTWWGIPGLRHQWNPSIPESEALRVPSPITRDEKVQEVTLKEAIAIALANNPGIAARRLEPGRVGTGILQAQSQFDPAITGDIEERSSITPNASSLSSRTTTKVDDRFANFHLMKTLRPGTLVSIDSLNERLDNNSSFIGLRPEYIPQLNLSVVQPLLRGFGWDFSYLVVRVQEQAADSALYQYQANLANFVEQVIEAYWNVVSARENLEVQKESKALADTTVRENEARVKVGLFAPVAVLEAQADAAAREEQVIIAQNNLEVNRQRLAQLAYYRPEGTFVPRTLEPIDTATTEDIQVDVDQALGVALAERPEILASSRNVRARQLNERIAENGLLPSVNLVGSYGVNAVSGESGGSTSLVDLPSPFAKCVPAPGTTNAVLPGATKFRCVTPPSPFAGPASTAYDRLTSNDFRSYSFGIQLQVPLSNALARSQYAERRIETTQAEFNHRDLLSSVTLEVRQATADLIAARQRIDTTRVARELAEENLRNQEKRHEVGMATTKDLLDFQTRLTTARAAEVSAHIDYVTALARWRRAQGRLLPHYQIVFDQPGRHHTPWFARF